METHSPLHDGDAAPRILLVEDELPFARAVARRLGQSGFRCEIAGSLAECRDAMGRFQPDLLLLDLRLPDGDALEHLAELAGPREGREVAVIVMTAFGELNDAVQAMKLGAADYLKKPIDLDELELAVGQVLNSAQLRSRLDFSSARDRKVTEGVVLIGESEQVIRLREQIAHIGALAGDSATPPPTVLILGETGSGKDVAARLLHQSSPRRNAPFVHVDCAGLPRELIEAELFGHEKGAFTSAVRARAGLIEAAEDGTLFLDEIGEIPLELQAKLLSVIERRQVRRVGSVRERPILSRIVAATNRSLTEMVAQGTFRADLYFRLNVITLSVPPLRDRAGDAVALAVHYAGQTARRYGLAAPEFLPAACAALASYRWPGNVRELRHLVERAVLLSGGRPIAAADLGLPVAAPAAPPPLTDWRSLTLEAAERMLIQHTLADCAGNVSEAARRLGVTRMALRYRLEKYGIGPRGRSGGETAVDLA